ncbi:MAG: glycosyltransferase [Acidimicrobiales bacterium]|nr:glycosyltransferase [Acidimicrobiales bacterium]
MDASPIRPVEERPAPVRLELLLEVLDDVQAERLRNAASQLTAALGDRTIWNLNTTATGGGVAEMLHPMLAYGRGADIDVRWLVLGGEPEFFRITKRLHHAFHDSPGDGGPLGPAEHEHFEAVAHANADEIDALVRPGDVCICHDPQTAGIVPALVDRGALVIWRSHIGSTTQSDRTRAAWDFIADDVRQAHRLVFSRQAYVPEDVGDVPVSLIAPSIDPLAPKNRDLTVEQQRAILGHVGILRCEDVEHTAYERRDGSPARVDHVADIVRAGASPTPDTPLVVQVSRWDPLKDMAGVMHAFAEFVDHGSDAQLVLAGPNVSGVADDPEGAEVLEDCIAQWRDLPHAARARIALVCLPMADAEENATIVNALQRHASVVVQKSLQEGFGLTVSEAMWKSRPVVGSAVGGIVDQIVDGETGRLVEPTDLEAFGTAVAELLVDPARAEAVGKAARERTHQQFLVARHLVQFAELITELVEAQR